jgi:signal transduction histidine kinase
MEVNFISYVPAVVGILSIACFVLLNARNSRNKVFALLNFLIAVWLFGLFLANNSHNATLALWFFRLALFAGQLMFLFFYYFSLVFPYQTKINKARQVIYSLPMAIISILLLTPLGVSSVTVTNYVAQSGQVTFLYTFSDLVGIAYLLLGMGIILFKYRKSDIKQRSQIKFVLIGLSIALVVNIVTGEILTLLGVDSSYVNFGGFSLFIFSLFVAYAIIRHGFLDIRLIVARTLAYTLTLGTIAVLYSAIIFGVAARIVDMSHVTSGQQLLYISVAVFLSFTFQSIKQFFNKLSNRIFYRDAYDTQAFLDEFNKTLVTTYKLDLLLKNSILLIGESIKPTFSLFVINATAKTSSKVLTSSNRAPQPQEITEISEEIRRIHTKVIVTDDLEEGHKALRDRLNAHTITLVAQLTASTSNSKHDIGYLMLGPKKSGNLYSTQDIRVIEIIANELVIAVQNALRFEEIEHFNATLQEKVNEATKKLRHANQRLKELDETKDDFISMASHQLRTPLTSVKGYISMIMEGDAGKINHMQREMLGQAFFSSQRMVYLIADLLNVSRLKTGKFVIEPTPVDLSVVVEEELGQLEETAASRSLKLIYDKPKEFPLLLLDEVKIRQVIMNFVDNAIYYTPPEGQIDVRLTEKGGLVELRVTDDGIGVPKREQPHLFTKFYRAGNARKARPDGTGLGLFMAKKVIVAQSGSLIFVSKEGKGSTFGFMFSKSKLAAPVKSLEVTEKSSPEADKAKQPAKS